MKNKSKNLWLALAFLIGAGFASGAAASPQAPMSSANCQKIVQSNGAWIASVCPVPGKLGNNVVGVDVFYWGYLSHQQTPYGSAPMQVQVSVRNDAGEFLNTPLRRDSVPYFTSPANGFFLYGRYLTALPRDGMVDLELYFWFNGQEDSDYGRNYRARLGF